MAIDVSARTYGPAEICNMFNITKPTLFRWESVGHLPSNITFPSPRRGRKEERIYSLDHIRAIAQDRLRLLGREFERIIESDLEQAENILVEYSLMKAKYFSDPRGLLELIALGKLSPVEILEVLHEMLKNKHVKESNLNENTRRAIKDLVLNLFYQ